MEEQQYPTQLAAQKPHRNCTIYNKNNVKTYKKKRVKCFHEFKPRPEQLVLLLLVIHGRSF